MKDGEFIFRRLQKVRWVAKVTVSIFVIVIFGMLTGCGEQNAATNEETTGMQLLISYDVPEDVEITGTSTYLSEGPHDVEKVRFYDVSFVNTSDTVKAYFFEIEPDDQGPMSSLRKLDEVEPGAEVKVELWNLFFEMPKEMSVKISER